MNKSWQEVQLSVVKTVANVGEGEDGTVPNLKQVLKQLVVSNRG